MLDKLYWDSETIGYHGLAVLFQFAVEDGPITVYDIWYRPVRETLKLIEWYTTHCVVAFNITFDHFHIQKLYSIWRLLNPDWIPIEHIQEIAMIEARGQDGPCVKPANALDLLLHSRKGPYQSLMAREDVRIRRVPTALAYALQGELEKAIEFDGIYFAKTADKTAPKWHVYDIKKRDGTIEEHFKDVCLKFNPAGGLKFLAEYALGYEPKFKNVKAVEPKYSSKLIECGYAPTALAVSDPERDWNVMSKDGNHVVGRAWPALIREAIEHWKSNSDAREYATYDIVYLRDLDKHFGYPEPGDDDSVLACMVASVRWRGFRINVPGVQTLLKEAEAVMATSPVNINKSSEVRRYLNEVMDDTEKSFIEETTRKTKLEAMQKTWDVKAALDEDEDEDGCRTEEDIAEKVTMSEVVTWTFHDGETCMKCKGGKLEDGTTCKRCQGHGKLQFGRHPAAIRADELLEIKGKAKEVELYKKLLRAGKIHMDFNVIGALSGRMSGASGLNAQGIKREKKVRSLFPLAWDGEVLSIGDFESFEVCILDAVVDEPKLHVMLTSGESIHAKFGTYLFKWPDGRNYSYTEIKDTKGTKDDKYSRAKNCLFGGVCYGGNEHTLIHKYNIDKDIAPEALAEFYKLLPGIKAWRDAIEAQFCSMKQPEGLGRKVVWTEPADKIESLLGFPRFFTLENRVAQALFHLAQKPPPHWKKVKAKVVRRDRVQVASGAVQSALYSAAFQIQAANTRQAANHQIQSTGAQITKAVQRKLWDTFQPAGIHYFRISLANVHDEIIACHQPELTEAIAECIDTSVASYRNVVPLISMEWKSRCNSWADK